MDFLQDKYILVAVAGILIIATICVIGIPEEGSESEIVGVVSEVRTTENGNTFFLTDATGNKMKCFFSERVNDGIVCSITGRHSDDGSIFFVSKLVTR